MPRPTPREHIKVLLVDLSQIFAILPVDSEIPDNEPIPLHVRFRPPLELCAVPQDSTHPAAEAARGLQILKEPDEIAVNKIFRIRQRSLLTIRISQELRIAHKSFECTIRLCVKVLELL